MGAHAELAGSLRERLRFEDRNDDRTASGERSGEWRAVWRCWGSVEPIEAIQPSMLIAQSRQTRRRWRITIRSSRMPTLDMRVIWRGQPLRLIGLLHDPRQPDRRVVLAEEQGS